MIWRLESAVNIRAGALLAISLACSLACLGCRSTLEFVGIRLFYDESPEVERIDDIPYRPGSEDPKHRLDLFQPAGKDWPTLVFAHGGGWTAGDKSLVVSGADVYANIGRFYAARGFGVALINYRLQPEVTWRDQVDDVATAVHWLSRNLRAYGGDDKAIFLSGHSAGAQLAARVGVDQRLTADFADSICGVISVSGAGYDLADQHTYQLDADFDYYEQRFRADDPTDDWLTDASTIPWVDRGDPPFLLLYSLREWKSLGYQNQLLGEAIQAAEGRVKVMPIQGQNHGRMVLAMTRTGTPVSDAVLRFLRSTDCPG